MIAVATLLALALAQTPEELVRQLGHEEASRREEAATAIEALGDKALPALEQGAKSEDPEVRERAKELLRSARQLREFGVRLDADRLAATRQAIGDRVWNAGQDPWQESAYLEIIHLLRPEGADTADIPYLLSILLDPGEGGDPVGGLARAEYLRVRALQAIRDFPIVDENEKRLIRILEDVLPSTTDAPDEAQARYPVAVYAEVCQITQGVIRDAVRNRVDGALGAFSRSPQVAVRTGCAGMLGHWTGPASTTILAELLADPESDVQLGAARATASYDDPSLLPALRRVISDSPSLEARLWAGATVARLGQIDGLTELFGALQRADRDQQAIALDHIQSLVDRLRVPFGPDRTAAQSWLEWWKTNQDKVRWDADLEMFVTP